MKKFKFAPFVLACAMLATTAMASPATSAADPAAQRGGVLQIALLGLDSSDPHRHAGSIAVQQIYVETLTSIADDGRVQPFLAERYEVSEDGKRYVFHLRDDVQFHNGRPLNSADVKANFDRVSQKVTGGWLSGAMKLVRSVQTPDSKTVVVELEKPYAPFLNLISELWIVAPESAGWDDHITQPIGTGPFKFGRWQPDVQLSAPRFDQYWQKGLPYLDEVVFDLRGSRDNSLGLRAGDVHIGYVGNDKIEGLKKAGFDVQTLKDTAWYFLSFNNRNPSELMANPLVREAIASAIDKKAYMNFVAGQAGMPSNQPMRPGTYYWDQSIEQGDKLAAPNLERARALLAQAGVKPSDHTLKIVSWQRDYSQVAAQMVRALGFKIDHQALDDIGAQKLLGQYQWDLAPFNSGPRADVYLRYARFLSNGPSPMLWGGIQDEKLDAMIAAAVSSPNSDAARANYLDAWRHMIDKQYTVGIGHAADTIAVAPAVRGYQTGYTWSQNRVDGGVARTWLAR